MSIPTYAKNAALDGLTYTQVSLHSAYPGTTGGNEISGSPYARQTATIAAASGGQRVLSAAVSVPVPASTIRWLGWWDGSNFMGGVPNGGHTPKNFVAYDDTIHCPIHGYTDTQTIVFWGGTAPSGLVTGTTYYVRDSATNSFKVAATSGGVAISMAAPSSFGCVVSRITDKTYAIDSAHTITSATFTVPD